MMGSEIETYKVFIKLWIMILENRYFWNSLFIHAEQSQVLTWRWCFLEKHDLEGVSNHSYLSHWDELIFDRAHFCFTRKYYTWTAILVHEDQWYHDETYHMLKINANNIHLDRKCRYKIMIIKLYFLRGQRWWPMTNSNHYNVWRKML